ncbi:MAG: NAD(P)H-dependent oxidoreductase [Bacteroidia bacterium]|nr:NAD(P)H-dependent oxidoreductase [Bacteroidia bacterium]
MNIAILSGSARTNNNTIRVAKAIERLVSPQHHVTVVDFQEYDIPLIAQGGMPVEGLSSFQSRLVQAMDEAKVILIISPEYNWSTTPEILNILHLLPTKPYMHLFSDKVFSVVGVSTGKGGKAPALHIMQILNKVISFANLESLVAAKIFESHFTKDALDENGNSLGNALYDQGLQAYLEYTLKISERWFKP